MIDIKKYSNGRFFDAVNRKFIKADRIKEFIKKGEEIKVTLTTTGEEITESIIAQYTGKRKDKDKKNTASDSDTQSSLKKECGKAEVNSSEIWKVERFLNTDSMKSWVSDVIDKRINQVLEIINLPTRDQISELNANIRIISQKIDALKMPIKEESTATKAPDLDDSQLKNNVQDLEITSENEEAAKEEEVFTAEEIEAAKEEEISQNLLFEQKKNPFEEFADKTKPAAQNTTTKTTIRNTRKRARKKV